VRGGGAGDRTLELHAVEEPKEATHGPFVIRLEGLRPLPRAGQAIKVSDYVATLRIRRP